MTFPFQLPENSPAGHIVGHLKTIDPDLNTTNQTFRYTIITDPHDLFTLEEDQLIVNVFSSIVSTEIVRISLLVNQRQRRGNVYSRA